MEVVDKDKEMEMSLRHYSTSDDRRERRRKPATGHETLDTDHRRSSPSCSDNEIAENNKRTGRVCDPNLELDSDPDPDPVSATPVIPLPRSYARPVPPPAHSLQQQLVRYRECQRNHAASSGGHVFDGCGEFMPVGNEGTPESLRCAACNCHRSFHRREVDGEVMVNLHNYSHYNMVTAGKITSQRNQAFPPPQQPSPLLLHHHVSPIMMRFGGGGVGGPAESSTEDLNKFHQSLGGHGIEQFLQPKKRFRTKFNEEQKEKMQEFADKIGWKINKQEEEQVQRFCSQINVKRQVFKVWMHNNKQTAKKKQM